MLGFRKGQFRTRYSEEEFCDSIGVCFLVRNCVSLGKYVVNSGEPDVYEEGVSSGLRFSLLIQWKALAADVLKRRVLEYILGVIQRNRLAWPHRRRGLASDGVRYAGARSSVGRRVRSVTKLRLEWDGGVFLFLQQRQNTHEKWL